MTTVRLCCGQCPAQWNIPESLSGRKVRCPKCGGVNEIPDLSAMISPTEKQCPFCKETIQQDARRCSHCQKDMPTPSASLISLGTSLSSLGTSLMALGCAITLLVYVGIPTLLVVLSILYAFIFGKN